MAKYIRQTSPYNTQIVALGIDTYLKMLLHDNFVVSLRPSDHLRFHGLVDGKAMLMMTRRGCGRSTCTV